MLKNYLYGVYGLYYLALSTVSYSYYPIDVVRNLNCKWAHLGSIGITCSEFKLKTTLQDALQYFVDVFNLDEICYFFNWVLQFSTLNRKIFVNLLNISLSNMLLQHSANKEEKNTQKCNCNFPKCTSLTCNTNSYTTFV